MLHNLFGDRAIDLLLKPNGFPPFREPAFDKLPCRNIRKSLAERLEVFGKSWGM
jgi:hypothetical protein